MTYQLPFKTGDKIIELGGGENPTFHPNFDVRQLNNVDRVVDFNSCLPIPDNSFDGVFSKYMLEHISWRRIKPFLRDIFRIIKPTGTVVFITANLLEQCKSLVNTQKWNDDLICMIFGGQRFVENRDEEIIDIDWDSNSHHSGFSPQYITEILQNIGFDNIKIVPIQTDKGPTDMIVECSKPNNIHNIMYNNKVKLNIGSFKVMSKGWINIDILDLNQYAIQNGFEFKQMDTTKGLPYQDNTVDIMLASHFMEHITREEGLNFLKESFRILKPNSIIRLTIPDTEIITKDYISGNIARHASHNEGVKNAEDDTESLFHLLIAGHQTLYDYKSLSKLLEKVGFTGIKKQEYQKSYSKEIETETRDMYPELSLYLEAKKPDIKKTILSNGPIITTGMISEENSQIKSQSQPQSKQEMQYKFSVIYSTYRPGSMDLLLSSLSKQTYKNFELILVDDYPPRTNNKQELYNKLPEIPSYIKYHNPPKPDCFNKFYRFGTNINTGIIESIKSNFNSDIIIFLQDYTYLPPNQLEKWNAAFNKTGLDSIITGTATIYSTPNPIKWRDNFSIWEDSITESILDVKSEEEFKNIPGFKYHSQWTPTEYEGFYTGIPKEIATRLNGLDENIDYPCEQANDFFERAKIAGYKLIVNPELNCLMMDHRSWHPPDNKDDYLWHIYRIESVRKEKAPEKYSLEYYVAQINDGKRSTKADNCFDLEKINQESKSRYIQPINVENAYSERIRFQIDSATKCGGKILNIGCADCYPFVDSKLDILHIDTTDQVPESVKPQVNFKLIDAHSLPFNDKEFNCALLGDTLEHVNNPIQVLKEAKRVSKNIYISVPNEHGWDKSLNPFNNPGHIRHYTYETLISDLNEGLGKDSYEIKQYNGGGWSFWTVSYEEQKKLKFKIGLISTPFFTIPPKGYSGLEMIVWDLACGLDELGHTVTIFGPEGSRSTTHGYLMVIGPSIDTVNVDWFEEEKKRYNVYKDIITPERFDLVHDMTWFGFPYLLKGQYPSLKILHTHHGGLNWESPPPIQKPNLIAISNFMRQYTEQYFKQKGYNVNCKFVRNGIDVNKYPFQQNKSDRLLFVGRLSTFKQPHIAVELARKTNHKLDIIGSATFVDSTEYVNQLDKLIENDLNIKIYKDASHNLKIEKMRNAKALIFPSRMNEPAGLVACEAMSCGTPVIAFDDGAIKEYVINNRTGFICKDINEMVEALNKIDTIDPNECRKRAMELSRDSMAKNYENLYYKIMKGEEW